ncbi:MAG: response regulator [Polyangiaceae bacterium]
MAKTLLAVDDSTTMRKVLEITFGGDDFDVVTADSRDGALEKLTGDTSVVLIDTALGSDDGYALCKDVRAKAPSAAILLLASRFNAYDAAKGQAAGADDFLDKPFDTQQAIDKVRKLLGSRDGGTATEAAKPAAAAATPAAAAAKPAPAPAPAAAAAPASKPKQAAAPAAAAAVSNATASMAGKMEGLGLSKTQEEAVLALSREVVERVVWEVVPQLAEVLIKEEIARLMKA